MDAGGNNRYELLFSDDDADNSAPAPVVQQKPAKAPKAAAPTTKKPNVQANKENKSNALTKETANKKAAPKPNAPAAVANKGNRPPTTERANAERSGPVQERRNVGFKPDSEVREQRNNRRNLRTDEFGNAGQQRPFRENRENRDNRDNRDNRENRGNFRNREGGNFRGKREFDRQSGSDKTGVKAVDKREGAGAHNWGSVKQEIENADIAATDADTTLTDKEENEVNESAGETPAVPEEETVKEMTLDEYKALRQQREKPKYNIRKPGEGEDTAQWKKMVVLSKKKDPDSEEEFEFDPSLYPQRVGRLQRIVDIQFNFKDGRRGGGNFGGRGRGGPRGGGAGGDRGRFERGDRERGDRERGDRERGDRERGDRERNDNAGGGRQESGKQRNFGERQQKSGIKVDYESQFPTLG